MKLRGGLFRSGLILLTAALAWGCAPSRRLPTNAPSPEVLANHLIHAKVRCGSPPVLAPGEGGALGQGVATAPVLIRHQHHMGGSFRLQSLRYALNGQTLCTLDRVRSRALEQGQRAVVLLRARLPVGTYAIQHRARYRGHGSGVFSYMKGYKYRVAGGGRFTVRVGQPLCVDVYSIERKASSLKERPQVRVRLEPSCAALRNRIRRPAASTPGR